jgi:anti-sigma factor RsiW
MCFTRQQPPDPAPASELHAYLDGELPRRRVAAVEAFLREHPDTARRLANYCAAGEAIALLHPRPALPPALRRRVRRMRASRRLFAAAAAGILFAALGYAAGALNAAETLQAGHAQLLDEITEHHRVFARETAHLVEIGADRQDELVAWLSRRLGRKLAIPDLSTAGITFAGGRMVLANGRPAGQLLYTRPEAPPIGICIAPGGEMQPRMVEARDGLRLASWNSDGYTYVVVGEMSDAEARGIADSVVAAFRG